MLREEIGLVADSDGDIDEVGQAKKAKDRGADIAGVIDPAHARKSAAKAQVDDQRDHAEDQPVDADGEETDPEPGIAAGEGQRNPLFEALQEGALAVDANVADAISHEIRIGVRISALAAEAAWGLGRYGGRCSGLDLAQRLPFGHAGMPNQRFLPDNASGYQIFKVGVRHGTDLLAVYGVIPFHCAGISVGRKRTNFNRLLPFIVLNNGFCNLL